MWRGSGCSLWGATTLRQAMRAVPCSSVCAAAGVWDPSRAKRGSGGLGFNGECWQQSGGMSCREARVSVGPLGGGCV
jgi:hypothetical protein